MILPPDAYPVARYVSCRQIRILPLYAYPVARYVFCRQIRALPLTDASEVPPRTMPPSVVGKNPMPLPDVCKRPSETARLNDTNRLRFAFDMGYDLGYDLGYCSMGSGCGMMRMACYVLPFFAVSLPLSVPT